MAAKAGIKISAWPDGRLAEADAGPVSGRANKWQLQPGRRRGTATLVANGESATLVPLLDSNTRTQAIATKIPEDLVKFDADSNEGGWHLVNRSTDVRPR
nr:hypothetical protein [uncultured Rhodopila sp.]